MPALRIHALEYHDVVGDDNPDLSGFPGPAAATYKLSRPRFEAHLSALATCTGPIGVSMPDALAWKGGYPAVLLTFDDGGVSAKAAIAPALEARGWRAHIFIATDFIGTPGFLSASDLQELHARGHIVGSHSCSHPTRMSACSMDDLRREWRESVSVLSGILGTPVQVASVPGGYFSRAVAQAAAEAGVRALFTSEPVSAVTWVGGCAVVGRYTLRRGHSPSDVVALVRPLPLARLGQWVRWNSRKLAKVLLGRGYLRLRSALLGERVVAPTNQLEGGNTFEAE